MKKVNIAEINTTLEKPVYDVSSEVQEPSTLDPSTIEQMKLDQSTIEQNTIAFEQGTLEDPGQPLL